MTPVQLLAALRAEGVRVGWERGELHCRVPQPSARIEGLLQQLSAHRVALAALLRGVPRADDEPLASVPAEVAVPASFEQRRFLFLDELEGPADTYNLTSCFHIRGRLDVDALVRAVRAVVASHDVLRTRFVRADGQWQQQVIDREADISVTTLDSAPADACDSQLRAFIDQDRRQPFDLANGPHLRVRVVRLAADDHRLVVVMHHIVSDGHSIRLFVGAVREAYVAAAAGMPVPRRAASLQYRDYAARQHADTARETAAGLDYWREQLRDAPPLLDLQIARARPGRLRSAGDVHTFRLERQWAALTAVCARHELTPFHCLLGAYALTLARHAGVREVVVGSPMSTRRHRDTAGIIGPFINLLALRIRSSGADSGQDYLRRVRATVLDGMEHAGVPFEKVVESLAPARSAAHTPLFQQLFALEDVPPDLMQLPGAEVSTESVDHPSAKYDAALIVQRDAHGYAGMFRYRTDLYAPEAIERLAATFVHVLDQLTTRPQAALSDLMTLTPDQHAGRLRAFSGAAHPQWGRCCLHELVERQADATPDLPALKFDGEALTYAELDRRANRYAHWLRAHGAGPGSVVGIALDHGIAMVCAVLGIAKAGAAYLPVAPDDPAARIAYCLAQGGVRLVVASARRRPALGHDVVLLDVDDLAALEAQPDSRPALALDPRDPVSVLFTSGSTGTPKAVLTEHGALVNNLQWMQRCWPLAPGDRLLFKAPLTFDVSAKEIVWPLMAGAAVVVGRAGGRHDPAYLSRLMREEAVTIVHLVPTMLDYFIAEARNGRDLAVRIVMCGGEALSPALLARFHAAFDADLLHLYGPTEAAIAITGCVLPRQDEPAPLPLGLATDNSAVYLLDDDGQPVPDGVIGEIYIGGVAVARGYHGRPGATAAAFVPDPYSPAPGSRMYATGDLARVAADGGLIYMGRRDHQVKLYGQRIELGEIEAAIRQHASIKDCVVVAAPGPAGRPTLKAFVVAQSGAVPTDTELRAFLRERLATHMLPTACVYLDAIPLLSNGKADRAGLAARAGDSEPAAAAHDTTRAPRAIEHRVARLWSGLLERSDIGLTENFFAAGGHSLLAIELRNRLRAEFGIELDVADLFAHATIEAQAELVQQATAPRILAASQPVPHTIAEHDDRVAVIGMAGRFPGADDLDTFWRTIAAGADVVRRYSRHELVAAGYPADIVARPEFVPVRAAIDDVERFDAAFFGCTPMEAALLDPQHRLLLECAQWALDDAGYAADVLARQGARVGVFVGVSTSSYYEHHLRARPEILRKYGSVQLAMSTGKSYAATQLAFRLNLHGPAIGIDTACSTSLVAIALACQALRAGEAELVLAGGASIDVPVAGGHLWQDGAIGSRDGHCRPFDADGSGTVKGMGGGIVLLKPLAAALRDGDAIRAVILGAATNNDGSVKVGFTAPGGAGQTAVMRAALQRAAVPAASIGYVETHGTGTPLGDPIEIRSLAQVYAGGDIVLGAVKGNIGHLDAAAGVAGFIKTVLVLERQAFPPVANFRSPNTQLNLTANGFAVPTYATPWPPGQGPRRAAVSAFGIGGTNAHAIVEEAPPRPEIVPRGVSELFVVSAKTPAALAAAFDALAAALERPQPSLAEIAYTLAVGRSAYPHRRAIVASDRVSLLRRCRDEARLAAASSPAAERPRIAFVAPRDHAGADDAVRRMYRVNAVFARTLDRAADALGWRMAEDGPPTADPDVARAWRFAVAAALADAMRDAGIVADACIGDDVGEYVAAYLAGSWMLEEGIALLAGGTAPARTGHGSDEADVYLGLGTDSAPAPFARAVPATVVPLLSVSVDADTDGAGDERVCAGFLTAIGAAWQAGARVEWERLYAQLGRGQQQGYRRTHLPGYRFDRAHHWIDAPDTLAATTEPPAAVSGFARIAWTRFGRPAAPGTPLSLILCHDGSDASLRLLAQMRRKGRNVESTLFAASGCLAMADARGAPAVVLVTGAVLLESAADAGDVRLAAVAAAAAAAADLDGVVGVAIVAADTFDATGDERPQAPFRAALARRSLPIHAGAPRRFVDLPSAWSDGDVDGLLDLAASGGNGIIALRHGVTWRPVGVPMPLPMPATGGRFAAGHRCYIAADARMLRGASVLAAYLAARGAHAETFAAGPGDASSAGSTAASPGATLFLLASDAAPAGEFRRLADALRWSVGRVAQVFAFVAHDGGEPAGSALALATTLEQVDAAAPFLVVESAAWDNEADDETFACACDFAAAAFQACPNAIVAASPEVIVRWHHRARRAPPAARAGAVQGHTPSTPSEQAIAAHWKDLLGVDVIGAADNFFSLGGDSLLAGQSLTHVNDAFGVALTAEAFHANANVAALARLVDAVRRANDAAGRGETPLLPATDGARVGRDRWEL